MSGREPFILLLVLAAGCATPRRWSAPPKSPLSFEAATAVAREMGQTAPEAPEAPVAPERPEAPGTPETPEPPRAAEAPACPRERVYADEFKNLVQASGCGRLIYLQKVPGKPGEPVLWRRVGPEFRVSPQNDLHEAEVRLQGARLRTPVRLAGAPPLITMEQAKTLRSWNPKAVATCLLGVDGALHACFVQADEPVVEKAVTATMPTYRFKPATADGVPIPATFQMTVNVPVPKPNCAGLSDPILENRCEARVRSPDGPAAADPELWDLPLGW